MIAGFGVVRSSDSSGSRILQVAPRKGVMEVGNKGQLNPKFIWPIEILNRVEVVACYLALPLLLSTDCNVFHVLMLWKYMVFPSHVIDYELVVLNVNKSYEKTPVKIRAFEQK